MSEKTVSEHNAANRVIENVVCDRCRGKMLRLEGYVYSPSDAEQIHPSLPFPEHVTSAIRAECANCGKKAFVACLTWADAGFLCN